MRISIESDVEARARYQAAMDVVKREKSHYLLGTKLTEKDIDKFDKRIRQVMPDRITARRTLVVGKVEIPLPGKRVGI